MTSMVINVDDRLLSSTCHRCHHCTHQQSNLMTGYFACHQEDDNDDNGVDKDGIDYKDSDHPNNDQRSKILKNSCFAQATCHQDDNDDNDDFNVDKDCVDNLDKISDHHDNDPDD